MEDHIFLENSSTNSSHNEEYICKDSKSNSADISHSSNQSVCTLVNISLHNSQKTIPQSPNHISCSNSQTQICDKELKKEDQMDEKTKQRIIKKRIKKAKESQRYRDRKCLKKKQIQDTIQEMINQFKCLFEEAQYQKYTEEKITYDACVQIWDEQLSFNSKNKKQIKKKYQKHDKQEKESGKYTEYIKQKNREAAQKSREQARIKQQLLEETRAKLIDIQNKLIQQDNNIVKYFEDEQQNSQLEIEEDNNINNNLNIIEQNDQNNKNRNLNNIINDTSMFECQQQFSLIVSDSNNQSNIIKKQQQIIRGQYEAYVPKTASYKIGAYLLINENYKKNDQRQ